MTNDQQPLNENEDCRGPSLSTVGLGMLVGSVMFELKSEPNQVTAMDFVSLLVGDGCMVIAFSGGDKTYNLDDVCRITVRPNVTRPEKSSADCKDA